MQNINPIYFLQPVITILFSVGLTLLAACLHKKRYLLVALPMGLIDFLVPFANRLNIDIVEISLFTLAPGCLGLTLFTTKRSR